MAALTPVSAPPGTRGQVLPPIPASAVSLPGKAGSQAPASGISLELSPEAKAVVAKLKVIDAKVRAHEAAHVAAGGGVVKGGATYTYERGPDGKQYAVGGEVAIDTGDVPGDPKATLAKAQQIQKAALAPSDPSAQDRAVAAAAAAMAAAAALELARARWQTEEVSQDSEEAKGLQWDQTV